MNYFLNGVEVFVDGDQVPAISLSLNDLLDPTSIRGSRSTTIRIINTPESRTILGSEAMAWDDPAVRPVFEARSDGMSVFTAPLVVLRATRGQYECAAVGGNATWFDPAKKTKLNEIDLGTSQRITASVIADTWSGLPGYFYFPLIDFGKLEDRPISYEVPADVFRPAIGVKPVLKKFFLDTGWHLDSRGLFDAHFRKMVLTNGGKDAKSIDDGNGANSIAVHASIDGTPSYSFKRYGDSAPDPVDDFDLNLTLNTAGLFNTAINAYRADRDVSMHLKLVQMRWSIPSGYVGLRFRVSLWDSTDGREVVGVWTRAVTGDDTDPFEFSGELPSGYVLKGHDVFLAIMLDTAYGSSSDFGSLDGGPPNQIQYNPEADYLYDSRLVINTAAPAMSVMDVLKGINDNRAIIVNTILHEKRVELWYERDFLRRPVTQADAPDFTARIDHTTEPAKLRQQLPERMLYRFKQDPDDREVTRITRLIGPPGYANADVDLKGYLDDRIVTLPWAATAMGSILDDELFVPLMRKVEGTYQEDDYDVETRLLIADGTAEAEWTIQADPVLNTAPVDLTYFPKCYFVWPGALNIPMAFGDAMHVGAGFPPNTTPGTTVTVAADRISRLRDSKFFEAMCEWFDHEIASLDFGQPYRINDGHSEGFFHVQEVANHRLEGGGLTKTRFIQLGVGAQADPPVIVPDEEEDGCCPGTEGINIVGAGFEAANGIYCYNEGQWDKVGGVPGEDSLMLLLSPDRHSIMSGGVEIYQSFDGPGGPFFATNEGYEPAPTITSCT